MDKQWVEDRVRWLLDTACRWVYKPADGLHTGPVKIDFLACGKDGRFWMVEVKQASSKRYYNPEVKGSKGISPLQRAALDGAAAGPGSVVLVAVWREAVLHIFNWRDVRQLSIWDWDDAGLVIPWATRALWSQVRLDEVWWI